MIIINMDFKIKNKKDNNEKEELVEIQEKETIKDNNIKRSESRKKSKKKKKKKGDRCFICNKKVGLVTFTCKCSSINLYCSKHRMPESHSCTYDWIKDAKVKLIKENPIIENSKLDIIK